MSAFSFRDGILYAESLPVPALAEAVGTPFYAYSRAAMETRFAAVASTFVGLPHLVCYAMKANSNQAVLRLFARLGAGMDVVSEGELRRARAAGVPGSRITFSGVGKTEAEMALGLDEAIHCFNVESEPELHMLSAVATARGLTARVAIRVNPDVDARTHAKITTGTAENKFGIPLTHAREVYRTAARLPGLAVTGVDMHIGSQMLDLEPLDAAFEKLADLVRALRQDGHAIDHADLGGGLGVAYRPDDPDELEMLARYGTMVRRHFGNLGVQLVFEPGRFLVGNAGILVTRVLLVKAGESKRFIVVDAAMNDLIRPTLYEAHHEIVPVRAASGAPQGRADIVGPVCESGDFLAQSRPFPEVAAGDLLAVKTGGAYGAVQANQYNSRLLVPEVLVDGDRHAIVRPRPSYADLIGLDRVPAWLT